LIRKVFRLGLAPGLSVIPLDCRHGEDRFVPRFLARFAATLVLTLTLFLTSCPDAAFAASPESPQQAVKSSEGTAPKSEAAEAWDAVKNTTNPALLEAFIKRYRTTFFAEIAKTRLAELKAAANKLSPADGAKAITTYPIHSSPGQEAATDRFRQPASQMPADGGVERAVLYEEDPSDPKGQRSSGSVVWHIESIKAGGKPDELAARADIEIPSRGLRVILSLRQNLDPSLPASHVIHLSLVGPTTFGGVINVPGLLMKSNEQARGTPLTGLAVKVTDGYFLVGLSSIAADRERNLKKLLENPWIDMPLVYANQRRAILAIDKSGSGEKVFKTVFTAWGQYPAAAQSEDTGDSAR
jgi:hypothetical protein